MDTCKIVGKECDNLTNDLNAEKITGVEFVDKYFDLVNKMPDGDNKNKVVDELKEYMTVQKEISFGEEQEAGESEIKTDIIETETETEEE